MAKLASKHVRYYENGDGTTIGTASRRVIEAAVRGSGIEVADK